MAPSNNKAAILTAAYAIAGRDGAAAVTLEAVAQEAGMSKSGLIYHFRSKDALMAGVMGHVVERWEQRLIGHLPVPLEQATRRQRVRAYVLGAIDTTDPPTAADLVVIVDAGAGEVLMPLWFEFLERWIPTAELTAQELAAVAAADGIWFGHALGYSPIPDTAARVVLDLIGEDQ